MSKEIRVTAVPHSSVELDQLGRALLEVVDSYDARTRKRLAARGERLLAMEEVNQSNATSEEPAA
jgi:hypothetical protein